MMLMLLNGRTQDLGACLNVLRHHSLGSECMGMFQSGDCFDLNSLVWYFFRVNHSSGALSYQ
jgi:hypothetical protein